MTKSAGSKISSKEVSKTTAESNKKVEAESLASEEALRKSALDMHKRMAAKQSSPEVKVPKTTTEQREPSNLVHSGITTAKQLTETESESQPVKQKVKKSSRPATPDPSPVSPPAASDATRKQIGAPNSAKRPARLGLFASVSPLTFPQTPLHCPCLISDLRLSLLPSPC